MKCFLKSLSLFLIISTSTVASQDILFNVTQAGFPPYLIKKEGFPVKGIMFEVLQVISEKHGYSVRPKEIPKNRVTMQIKSGQLDAGAIAKEWVVTPDDYEFTDVIIEVRDVLFSLKGNPIKFGSLEDLFGKKLGTHLGYHYPILAPYFKNKSIKRVDSLTERTMLEMTLHRRTDASVINELVGRWIIKSNPNWRNVYKISKNSVGGYGYRFIFGKKWKNFVGKFNGELSLMKKNGELDRIISKYQ